MTSIKCFSSSVVDVLCAPEVEVTGPRSRPRFPGRLADFGFLLASFVETVGIAVDTQGNRVLSDQPGCNDSTAS